MKKIMTWLRAIWDFLFRSDAPVAPVVTPEVVQVTVLEVPAPIPQEVKPRNPRHTKRISRAIYSTKTRKGLP